MLGSRFSDALLALAGDAHFASSDAYQAWLAGPNRVAFYRAPSANTSYAALDVAAPLGIITTAYLAGAGVSDVSPNHIGANLSKGDEARFVKESLIAQAAFGHQLLEQIWPDATLGSGRSAGQVNAAGSEDMFSGTAGVGLIGGWAPTGAARPRASNRAANAARERP